MPSQEDGCLHCDGGSLLENLQVLGGGMAGPQPRPQIPDAHRIVEQRSGYSPQDGREVAEDERQRIEGYQSGPCASSKPSPP